MGATEEATEDITEGARETTVLVSAWLEDVGGGEASC